MTQFVHFNLNKPLTLALSSVEPEPDGFRWNYETTDGKVLSVSRDLAIRINELDLKPSQPFCMEKVFVGPKEPGPSWRVWLPINKPVDVPPPTEDMEQQLKDSIELVKSRKPVRRHVHLSPNQERFPGMRRGTGTYGPAPLPQLQTCGPLPYADALKEITRTVLTVLDGLHEQWDPNAKQDLISTLLIQALKQNLVVFNFHTEAQK